MTQRNLFLFRSPAQIETGRRIRLSIQACAYEIYEQSLVSDHEFDAECLKVDLNINTNRPDLDAWWREKFDPCTGMWIHEHPELERVKSLTRIYLRNAGMYITNNPVDFSE